MLVVVHACSSPCSIDCVVFLLNNPAYYSLDAINHIGVTGGEIVYIALRDNRGGEDFFTLREQKISCSRKWPVGNCRKDQEVLNFFSFLL